MQKKPLLIVTKNELLIKELVQGLSTLFDVSVEGSIHVAYHRVLDLLPDTIVFDKTSYRKPSDFKNLKNFKATHFLKKTHLAIYCSPLEIKIMAKRYKDLVDEFHSTAAGLEQLVIRISRTAEQLKLNYWHECFMGLYHLMKQPVLLLEKDQIVNMNEVARNTFRASKEMFEVTDIVRPIDRSAIRGSLRKFAKGKHMKATTETTLRITKQKLRNARITISKLNIKIPDTFIMLIDFTGDEYCLRASIGSTAAEVENSLAMAKCMVEQNFTRREKEIITLLCKGYKTKEISEALFVSPKTVEKHRSSIIKRTNSDTILESIIYAINHNLVEIPRS
ncbi:response regulator transcription factor [Christiangramia sp. LLG6405-1]|uniref:response regulator transcription factor n=1 Tax=Christiangramia sp. LLG6405-1 TaxID=3160832 RepID=UPI0038705477